MVNRVPSFLDYPNPVPDLVKVRVVARTLFDCGYSGYLGKYYAQAREMELIINGGIDYTLHSLTIIQQLVGTPPDGTTERSDEVKPKTQDSKSHRPGQVPPGSIVGIEVESSVGNGI